MSSKKFEWKWSNGIPYEKTPRNFNKNIQSQLSYEEESSKVSQIAYQQSLLSENDVWSLEEQQIFVKPQDMNKSFNKREDTYNRMADREMFGQIGMSPFTNNNYLQDLNNQDKFLKPVSTTTERELSNELS